MKRRGGHSAARNGTGKTKSVSNMSAVRDQGGKLNKKILQHMGEEAGKAKSVCVGAWLPFWAKR